MSTIPSHSRLADVSNAALFRELTADNFAILAEEIGLRLATYQNGSPTTIIGPPTAGTFALAEFWRDALGGEWVCTVAGTPGTWIQIRPAPVTADPTSGTIPTGYLVWNVTDGAVKRHAGSYSWEITVGAGTSAKIGFHGATPTAQRAGAAQAAVTYASQTISDPPTRAEVQALNDGLVAVVTLLNEIRAAVVEKGIMPLLPNEWVIFEVFRQVGDGWTAALVSDGSPQPMVLLKPPCAKSNCHPRRGFVAPEVVLPVAVLVYACSGV